MDSTQLTKRDGAVYGIDISDERALISYINPDDKKPTTVSEVFGEEDYCIPMAIAKKSGIGQWFIGEEAIEAASANDVSLVPDFYRKALNNENIIIDAELFTGEEVLTIFLRRLFTTAQSLSGIAKTDYICFTVPEVTKACVELFNRAAEKLGLSSDRISIIEKKEAFYYYTLSQSEEINRYDVLLFECNDLSVYSIRLAINHSLRPKVVTLEENYFTLQTNDKDGSFDAILEQMLEGPPVSAIFLTGPGFAGDWMSASLSRAIQGRKVFAGQNLYTSGAVYAALVRMHSVPWEYTYIGDNELKINVSLMVSDLNQMKLYTLITAGQSWYEERGECEVILDGSPKISVYIQKPDSRKAVESVFTLKDLPVRQPRLTRLRITATPLSDKQISISIFDLGFGEIARGSGKIFTTTMGID